MGFVASVARVRVITAVLLALGLVLGSVAAFPRPVKAVDAPSFVSFSPVRYLDTRAGLTTFDGEAQGRGALVPNQVLSVPVAGRGGIPADVAGVALNVTATDSREGAYVTLFPCGAPVPVASTVNFGAGATVANGAALRPGVDGMICAFSPVRVDVVIDVTGYWPSGRGFAGLRPARLMDTRAGHRTIDGLFAATGAMTDTTLQVLGRGGVPATAKAVRLNVTAVSPASAGFVTVWPCGPRPLAANINYGPGEIVANGLWVEPDSLGLVCVHSLAPTDLVVDVNAYVDDTSTFTSVGPARLVDTRNEATIDGHFQGQGAVAAYTPYRFQVGGRAGVPVDVAGAVLNVTAVDPNSGPAHGVVTVWPCDQPQPGTSTLNPYLHTIRSNNTTTAVGAGGWVCLVSSQRTDIVIDIQGYFAVSADTGPPITNPVGTLPYPRIPWEGGAGYWNAFDKPRRAGWSDPGFFPIVLWYNGVSTDAEAAFDKAHGFNTYIGMWEGTPYSIFERNGIYWIGGRLNDSFHPDAVNWVGRMLDDEVDGRFSPVEGRAHLQSIVDRIPADGRFKYANFTQMVTTSYMNQYDARAYVNNYTDAVSVDMYWYTIPFCDWTPYQGGNYLVPVRRENCRTSSSYGKTVRALRMQDAADGKLQPVWQFVELYNGGPGGGPFTRAITPEELRGAVMSSVISEARGIVYFNQSLSGSCQGGSLLRQVQFGMTCAAPQVKAAQTVNLQLKMMAPVINSQSYRYTFGPGLDTMFKTHGGAAYVFAMIDGETRPGRRTLTLPPELRGRTVQVMFENRAIPVSPEGNFIDDFPTESTYRIYRVA